MDYLLDLELLPYDVKGTMAHAKMLKKIKILNSKELSILLKGLSEILELSKAARILEKLIKKSNKNFIKN